MQLCFCFCVWFYFALGKKLSLEHGKTRHLRRSVKESFLDLCSLSVSFGQISCGPLPCFLLANNGTGTLDWTPTIAFYSRCHGFFICAASFPHASSHNSLSLKGRNRICAQCLKCTKFFWTFLVLFYFPFLIRSQNRRRGQKLSVGINVLPQVIFLHFRFVVSKQFHSKFSFLAKELLAQAR